jgi:biotin carboxyl carrier protein
MAIGGGGREFVAMIQGRQRVVSVEQDEGALIIHIDGEPYHVAYSRFGDGESCLLLNGRPHLVHLRNGGPGRFHVALEGGELEVEIADAVAARLKRATGAAAMDKRIEIRSPMHGSVVLVQVAEGNEVEEETPLVVLEAMKMQNALTSPSRAVVREVLVEAGQTVEGETLLVVLDRLEG